jgi:hypothetical protein
LIGGKKRATSRMNFSQLRLAIGRRAVIKLAEGHHLAFVTVHYTEYQCLIRCDETGATAAPRQGQNHAHRVGLDDDE